MTAEELAPFLKAEIAAIPINKKRPGIRKDQLKHAGTRAMRKLLKVKK